MLASITLMAAYVVITLAIQFAFFLVSQFVSYVAPDWSLLVFLCLFMAAYGLAWPIAVRLTEPKAAQA